MLRRGQKVECIVNFAKPECVSQIPVKGAKYTIRDIVKTSVSTVFGKFGPFECLLLYELRNGPCECVDEPEAAFSVTGFRPIVEDETKTDISVFKKIEREVDTPITPDLEPVAFVRYGGKVGGRMTSVTLGDAEFDELTRRMRTPSGPSARIIQGQKLLGRLLRKGDAKTFRGSWWS